MSARKKKASDGERGARPDPTKRFKGGAIIRVGEGSTTRVSATTRRRCNAKHGLDANARIRARSRPVCVSVSTPRPRARRELSAHLGRLGFFDFGWRLAVASPTGPLAPTPRPTRGAVVAADASSSSSPAVVGEPGSSDAACLPRTETCRARASERDSRGAFSGTRSKGGRPRRPRGPRREAREIDARGDTDDRGGRRGEPPRCLPAHCQNHLDAPRAGGTGEDVGGARWNTQNRSVRFSSASRHSPCSCPVRVVLATSAQRQHQVKHRTAFYVVVLRGPVVVHLLSAEDQSGGGEGGDVSRGRRRLEENMKLFVEDPARRAGVGSRGASRRTAAERGGYPPSPRDAP